MAFGISIAILFLIVLVVFGMFAMMFRHEVRHAAEKHLVKLVAANKCRDEEVLPLLKRFPRSVVVNRAWVEISAKHASDDHQTEIRARAFIRRFPCEEFGFVTLAQVLWRRGNVREAEATLKLAIGRIRPMARKFWLYYHLAAFSQYRKDWPEAILRWRDVQARYPLRIEGLLGEARCLFASANHPAAYDVVRELLLSYPSSDEGIRLLAEIAAARQDWPSVADAWDRFRRQFDTIPDGYLRAAEARCKAGDTKVAKELISLARYLFVGRTAVQEEVNRIYKMIECIESERRRRT